MNEIVYGIKRRGNGRVRNRGRSGRRRGYKLNAQYLKVKADIFLSRLKLLYQFKNNLDIKHKMNAKHGLLSKNLVNLLNL